jgi:hypothetical protein
VRAGRALSDEVRLDALVKSTHTEFAAAFEGSDREKNPGRAQFYVADDQYFCPALEYTIKQFLPDDDDVVHVTEADCKDKVDSDEQCKWMTRPSIYGFGPNMTYNGMEFMSTGCFRIQVDGSRRVAIIKYPTLCKLWAQSVHKKVVEKVDVNTVMKWFKGRHPKTLYLLAAAAKQLHFAVVVPGDVLWTPPASITVEATHQGLRGWGLRIPVVTKCCRQDLEDMHAAFADAQRPRGHLAAMINALSAAQPA